MKKTIILLLLVIALTLTGCGNDAKEPIESVDNEISVSNETVVSDDTPVSVEQEVTSDLQSVEAQLQIIASNIDLWAEPADYANDVYHYAVTDLDSNGRLEIISSNSGGTGIYTYSTFYEINEDFSGMITCDYMTQEGDSQADIPVDSADGFYDSQMGIMYYIFDDLLRNGAAEYYENKRALYLEDGQVKEILLAYRTTIYTDSTPEITCMDKDQKEISEEEYNAIADNVFADLVKKKVYFGWCEFFQPDELKNMSEKELTDMLMMSYKKFRVE